ncbi:Peroxisomal membrane protein 2 [Apodemus speciosus]|uniref:Peroxisomal membrane protein 2 n=1 Tax=Apodemus speciosus TaxID=105296 RepID=A0ABQ0ESE7_APOSI
MAPTASKLRVEPELGSLPKRALAQYLLFLKLYPVATKAVSSGILSALGNFLAQMIKKQKKDSQSLEVSGLLRYLVYGCPLSHYLYLFMEYWVPPEVPWASVKRLLLDRLFFAPTFLLLFFFFMNFLEEVSLCSPGCPGTHSVDQGKNASVFVAKMRSGFWPALQMNWKMWTPLQFININYVPLQFRVLFANMAALFWYAYLASLGK